MARRLSVLRRAAWRVVWYAAAGLLVSMALVAGIVSQLLPFAERHPERVAQWLSDRANRSVRFEHMTTQWTRRGPLLRFEGLRVGDGADAVPIGAAELLISQYAGLLPGRSFTELRLRGLQLTLQRSDDGRWTVRGLPGNAATGDDPFKSLQGLGELQVVGGTLRIDAPALGIDARLPVVDARLQVNDSDVRIGLRAGMSAAASPIEASARFDRSDGDGRAYLSVDGIDLAVWSSLLRAAGVQVTAGHGALRAWAGLKANRVAEVTLDARLRAVALRGPALPGVDAPPVMAVDALLAKARWQLLDSGWRIDVPTLRVTTAGRAQTLDGLTVAGGSRTWVAAEMVSAGPLLAGVALSDRVQPGLRHWLLASRPDATLRRVRLSRDASGRLSAQARIDDARFSTTTHAPGISGLGGDFSGDGDGFSFVSEPAATFRFDWPAGFGAPHDVHLDGRITGWREGDGLRIDTAALRIAGVGYGADVRGGVVFAGGGQSPAINLVVRVDDADIKVADRFWVRNTMSAGTVDWLERGLVGGRVVDGRVIVAGSLNAWPFRAAPGQAAEGLFHASARLRGTEIRFLRDWPALNHLDADLDFVGNGFSLKGRGAIAGTPLSRVDAAIADYAVADLKVAADGAGDASALLGLLRASPLYMSRAATFDALQASGPAVSTVAVDVPLRLKPVVATIEGRIALQGVRLAKTDLNLAFDDVRGDLRFDGTGFDADGLRAVNAGQPATLTLRAGDHHVRDPAQAFEGALEASLTAAELLDRAPDLAWLKPYFSGRSPWTVGVAIPRASPSAPAGGPAPARLSLRSTLVGTRVDLPQPMRKLAPVPLATSIDTALPVGNGDVVVAFGQRLALRARTGGGQTGVRVAVGSSRVDEPAPASGLIASGRAGDLDAIDWVALAAGGGGGASPSLALQRIDVSADRLKLLGGTFANTRVRVTPSAGGIAVQVDGDALAGTVTLAKASGATIAGRFSRVHWSAPAPAAASLAAAPPATPAADLAADVDPSKIPPLSFTIDDLRVGRTVLGATAVRTQPLVNGLRIVQLQSGGDGQKISVTGDWLGRGSAARTRMRVDVTSSDFGTLLSGFGYGGQLSGGNGEAHLDAAWPGSPAGFSLARVQGNLMLVAKDGQLVEVNPGAGRVLGLLSVAQLPRRLLLDFRDFFGKGLAFNRIGGTVRFAGGQASSDDMSIESSAAEIRIRGSADLKAETFDQTIEVVPKSGNLLTVAGAIAGGPVGAAVGAVANAVLGRPLGEFGAKTYRVTGPWKDPKVDVRKRDDVDAAGGQATPAASRREESPAAVSPPTPAAARAPAPADGQP